MEKNNKVNLADPSALGLFGLAMVTLVASSQKLGWTSDVSLILPWAIFLGGLTQIFAGINDAKKNKVFGSTAFFGYGMFWLAVAFTWFITKGVFGENLMTNADIKELGFAFIGYFIFSVYMTVAATKTTKVLFTIFFLIDLLFLGLSLSVVWDIEFGHTLAAYSEFLISMFSFYASAAHVINDTFGREVLKLGKL
ncbi:MAG: hypothetical protein CSA13_01990 [Clostridiales bacterium]|nr:MAG: hypothetical protein CSA13_01990 [Clostridiales bacterium]